MDGIPALDLWDLVTKIPLLTKPLQLQIGNKIENNRTVSDDRRYSFIIIRKILGRMKLQTLQALQF